MANFDGTDAYFDSREVIERIAELEAEFVDATDSDPADIMSQDDWAFGLGGDGALEMVSLLELQEEAEGYISDWQYGEMFYTWDALVNYTEELVSECGYLSPETPSWITNNIDWEAVTKEVKVDFTEFEFRGTTYYAR